MNVFMISFSMMVLTTSINVFDDISSDSVERANDANEMKTENNIVDDDIADFLVKIADARMMGIQEGKEAEKMEQRKTFAITVLG